MGKSKHKISNWSQYNKALVNRGSLTFWIDEQAIKSWRCTKHHGRRGGVVANNLRKQLSPVIDWSLRINHVNIEQPIHKVGSLPHHGIIFVTSKPKIKLSFI